LSIVTQDAPLYKNLSLKDMAHLTSNLKWYFDQSYAMSVDNLQAAS
jgi:hypothetical protein